MSQKHWRQMKKIAKHKQESHKLSSLTNTNLTDTVRVKDIGYEGYQGLYINANIYAKPSNFSNFFSDIKTVLFSQETNEHLV